MDKFDHLLPMTPQEALELMGILHKDPDASFERKDGRIVCGGYRFANGPPPEADPVLDAKLMTLTAERSDGTRRG